MNERVHEYVNGLVRILSDAGDKGLPVEIVRAKLNKQFSDLTAEERQQCIETAINHLLDEWRVIKIIDYDSDSDLVWYLKALDEEESRRFHALTEDQKSLLKMLYDCNDERILGAMRRDEAIRKLNELGFIVEDLPIIPGIVSETGIPDKDGIHRWAYLIPQYEFSEEYKALQEESLEKSRKREERMMRESD